MTKLFFIILTLSLYITCSPSRVEPVEQFGDEYFSLQTGSFVIYDVDQTIHEVGIPSSTNFQLKESVIDSFINQAGGHTYTIHREVWDDVLQVWNLSAVWSARIENNEVVLAEGNTQYLKLKLPLIAGKAWDGNLYNTMMEETYTADSIDLPYAIDQDTDIEHTITIVQKDNQDIIVETDYRIEKYAPDIGLIYKEITNLEYCTLEGCIGQQIIESGLVYKQSIIAFGNE